jgi:uncharacterized protein
VFFSIQDLEVKQIQFDLEYPAGEIDFLDPEVRQSGPLRVEGAAELLTHTLGEVRIRGHVQTEMVAACSRCLEQAKVQVDDDFDLFYRPVETSPDEEEKELGEGEIEIAFYEGDGIQLEDVLREFILLAMPMQWVCRPDCKGICPVCGGNRNLSVCQCQVKLEDDRWAALKKLSS